MRTEHISLLSSLEIELQLTPMENPYEYVKEMGRNFDRSKIIYNDEYYQVMGLPNERVKGKL